MFRKRQLGGVLVGMTLCLAASACTNAGDSLTVWPTAGHEATWSDAGDGLQGRIVYINEWGYAGYCVLVTLRNVSAEAIEVPLAHPDLCPEGFVELMARGPGGWSTVRDPSPPPSRYVEEDEEEDEDDDGWGLFGGGPTGPPSDPPLPSTTLEPGQEAVLYYAVPDGPTMQKASQVKVVLRGSRAKIPGAWSGTLTTPPVGAHWPSAVREALAGSEEFPSVYPRFASWRGYSGNQSGHESEVWNLERDNVPLRYALSLFRPEGIGRAFTRRLAAEKNPPMAFLQASVAAGAGSEEAIAYLRRAMENTSYPVVMNVHSALNSLVHHFGPDQPAWLLEMVRTALTDTRTITDSPYSNADLNPITIGRLADEHGALDRALAHVKCREAVGFLIDMVRTEPSRGPIAALGEIGDTRAEPVLLDLLRATVARAEPGSHGFLHPAEFAVSVTALGELKSEAAVPILVGRTEFPLVVDALGRIGGRQAESALRDLIQAEGKVIRNGKEVYPEDAPERLELARRSLVMADAAGHTDRLCALLADQSYDEFARREAVWALGDHPDPRAVPALLETIQTDPSGAVVNQSIEVLSVYPYKSAVTGLIECFDADFAGKADWKRAYKPMMYRENIAKSLRTLTGQCFGVDKRQWQDWWQREGEDLEALQ